MHVNNAQKLSAISEQVLTNEQHIKYVIDENEEVDERLAQTNKALVILDQTVDRILDQLEHIELVNNMNLAAQSLIDAGFNSNFLTMQLKAMLNCLQPKNFYLFDLIDPVTFKETFKSIKLEQRQQGFTLPLSMHQLNKLPTVLTFNASTNTLSIIIQLPLTTPHTKASQTRLIILPQLSFNTYENTTITLKLHSQYRDQILVTKNMEETHATFSKSDFQDKTITAIGHSNTFEIMIEPPIFFHTIQSCLVALYKRDKLKISNLCTFDNNKQISVQKTTSSLYISTQNDPILVTFFSDQSSELEGREWLQRDSTFQIQLDHSVTCESRGLFSYKHLGSPINFSIQQDFQSQQYVQLQDILLGSLESSIL